MIDMSYRDMAVAVAKIAGQELIDRADELIPKTDGVKNVNICIRIPSLSDDAFDIPEIQVDTEVYPKKIAVDKIIQLIESKEV